MGVPALFRWLSKKYPKIVMPVIEQEPVIIPGKDGESETIPVDTTGPNPNGEEFDNLYLDMNGIVHPCTHPEGKEAPKTEEAMMLAVFEYTDRVVSMVRPRKLLMMAIDGVAPRAKMNQQRSRRFRSAQEARTKAEEKEAAIKEWEAMGKDVSDEYRNEKGWDSNAITPGTPFMDLLAKSLRYWVAKKLNEDPGWEGLQVIISDASVPGEGEHKIMDFIRRQRSHSSHDPNTKHVIYGLDADLIMLALATHEPHFRVLREDVFADDKKKGRGCHTCGQMGHHSSQCTGKPKEKQGEADVVQKGSSLKPFIFLDVSILREYLSIELSLPLHGSFPFSLERAIDDWVFLIFFVGNDFLPHLPSLEIREGAIDVLMGIWKSGLEAMGGYLTDNGKVNLGRAKLILDGLASREDEIFRKRREAEERQDRNDKRRKIDAEQRQRNTATPFNQSGPSHRNGIEYVEVNARAPLPPAPPLVLDSKGLPQKPTWEAPASEEEKKKDLSSMMQSNSSVVANRRAIRMANASAADILKAELAGAPVAVGGEEKTAEKKNLSAAEKLKKELMGESVDVEEEVKEVVEEVAPTLVADPVKEEGDVEMAGEEAESEGVRGVKRKAGEAVSAENSDSEEEEEDGVDAFLASSLIPVPAKEEKKVAPLKLLGNNQVEQEDIVKLWEPGYKERYYRQKFGVELSDLEFRNSVVKSYVEGLCWVLEYYFQGTPSWQWYYPHHFSPFASDFSEMDKLDIQFTLGKPFRPYEQLMGVFPADSRFHLPEPFQPLMIDDDSPIIDFYPADFEIDMNGKKMLWQGVALLPFIDPKRLLDAMGTKYPMLSDFENQRNTLGTDTVFVGERHPLYDYLEGLYTKKKIKDPVELDTKRSKGIAGAVLPDAACIPGATYDSPLPSAPDIYGDRSISATFVFPSQKTPHRSALLPGAKRSSAVLTQYDKDTVRRGGSGGYEGNGFHNQRQQNQSGPGFAKLDNRGPRQSYPPPQQSGGYGGGYGGPPQRDPYGGYSGQRGPGSYGGNGGGSGYGSPAVPSYGGYPQAQSSYGGNGGGYRPPPSTGYGGYGGAAPPPPGTYGGPPQQRGPGGAPPPPSYGGYGGYGGNGQSSYGGYGGSGQNNGSGGVGRRY